MTDHRPLPDSLDRLRSQLVAAAEREQATPHRRRHRPAWMARPVPRFAAIAGVSLALAGTATAAVVVTSSTGDLDRAATSEAPAVASLDGVLGGLREATAAAGRSPLTGEHGQVRGLTISRDGISVDVAADDRDICTAYRTAERPTGEFACADLPISPTAPPFQIGTDTKRTWLTSIVPDGTTDIAITGTDGSKAAAEVTNNIAIAILDRPVEISTLTFKTADGRTVTQTPGKDPEVTP